MDDIIMRVAVGLRLGSTLYHPHICRHCGVEVDHLAKHGLGCKHSEGRHICHAAVSDLIYRALTSVQIGLMGSQLYQTLVYDATCPDTYALSYRGHATSSAGAVAARLG